MWRGVLVEVRYYKGVCPSVLLPWRSYGWNCGGQGGDKLLYPLSRLASPVFTFQGRVLAMLLKLG